MNSTILSCIIVDDEQYAIDVLAHFINRTQSLRLLKTFTNSADALSWTMDNTIDLVFLDINMPVITGIEFARQIKGRAMVVFCSAHSEFGVESYNHNVIDYLLKPVEYSRFLQSIQKVKDLEHNRNASTPRLVSDFILASVEGRNKMVKVNYGDIYYLSGAGNYLLFHLRGQIIKSLSSIKEAEIKLPRDKFLRVHNSYIVAIGKIKSLDHYSINLHHLEDIVPIARSYREQVFEKLNS